VIPVAADFGEIPRDAKTNITIHIDVLNASAITITNAYCTTPEFAVSYHPGASVTNYVLDVTPKTPLGYGLVHEKAYVSAGTSGVPELEIPIVATVTGSLDVTPWELLIPNDASNIEGVHVRSAHDQPFKILQVVLPEGNVHLDKVLQTGDNEYLIRLAVQPDRTLNGKNVRILTDAKEMPEISIPFHLSQ
jgi:hypothetical protein